MRFRVLGLAVIEGLGLKALRVCSGLGFEVSIQGLGLSEIYLGSVVVRG